MKNTILSFFGFIVLLTAANAFAAASTVPAAQQAGGQEARRALQEKDLKLRQAVQKERVPAEIDKARQEEIQKLPDSQKVKVERIEVTGAKIISAKEIKKVTAAYEGKVLSIREMQDVANKITDLYRQKGYITSRAVLPPQKVENGILKIEVVEGTMGKVSVQGNKYYRSSLFVKKIGIKEGKPFNYGVVQGNLSNINQSPDHQVKTVLTPGQKPGSTDLVLNVKDRLPIHAGLSYDNYGSRYLNRNRYQGTLTHNNLLGFDDIMTLTYQIGEGHNTYRLNSLRYIYPVSSKTQLGFYAGKTITNLGREYKDLQAYGKSSVYSVYLTHSLYSDDFNDVTVSTAFDYKNVFNFELGDTTSQDRLRISRNGVKWDRSDSMGRTIINEEVAQGLPNQWGSLEEYDTRASREGAGGRFTKNVLDVIRLHRMPLESNLLLKGQMQNVSHVLPATEEFQIGGIDNVRGYPGGEVVGDNGRSATAELSFPLYGFPKDIRSPFSKAKIYDALRLATFYDWADARLRSTSSGESNHRALSSVGCGVRYDLPEDFSFRVDVAWPLDNIPSDGYHAHTWVKVSKDF